MPHFPVPSDEDIACRAVELGLVDQGADVPATVRARVIGTMQAAPRITAKTATTAELLAGYWAELASTDLPEPVRVALVIEAARTVSARLTVADRYLNPPPAEPAPSINEG